MIKGTLSTQETTGMEEGSKQRQSQLDNYCSSVISSKLIIEMLLDQNFFDSLHKDVTEKAAFTYRLKYGAQVPMCGMQNLLQGDFTSALPMQHAAGTVSKAK